MIEMGKQYRTQDRREVRLLCTDSGIPDYPVVAIVDRKVLAYTADGHNNKYVQSSADLIEVKPRINKDLWISFYPGYTTHSACKPTIHSADCLACVKVTIDCEEGEGL